MKVLSCSWIKQIKNVRIQHINFYYSPNIINKIKSRNPGYRVSGFCPSACILKNTIFWKINLFLPSGDCGQPFLMDLTECRFLPPFHLIMETDPVSKMYSVIFRIPDNGQSPKTQSFWGVLHVLIGCMLHVHVNSVLDLNTSKTLYGY